MPHIFRTQDIRGEFILLGTGTSVGVPVLGCGCAVCSSPEPKNKRTRCSAIMGLPGGNLLIDTPPDLRIQLLREGIGVVHAVLFTHEHADHIFGLDDLRLFPFVLNAPVPLYCEPLVEDRIRRSFDYAFRPTTATHPGAVPKLEPITIDTAPLEILGAIVRPLRMFHGPHYQSLGFRIGNVAYCTDTNGIPPESLDVLAGVEFLIVDALRFEPHPTHFHLSAALAVVEQVKPQHTFLTHLSHEFDHATMHEILPRDVSLGYDGLRIPLKLDVSILVPQSSNHRERWG